MHDSLSLLAYAHNPRDPLTIALAGVIDRAQSAGQRPLIPGLSEAQFQILMKEIFPEAQRTNHADVEIDPTLADERDDLSRLLLEHRHAVNEMTAWLAQAIASAAMRDNHLWQDMGLPDRGFLSGLLADYFPTLAARNTGGMKWKKFFYRQLCERAGVTICKSPNCGDCVDYRDCFGPEGGGTRFSGPVGCPATDDVHA